MDKTLPPNTASARPPSGRSKFDVASSIRSKIVVGVAIQPGLAFIVAASIALDNFSEALSIGALVTEKDTAAVPSPAARRRVLGWTGTIGAALFGSSVVSWLALRAVSDGLLALLIAVGAGGMFYLSVTELVPEAEARQYQHSSSLAAALGFVAILLLSRH